VTPDGIYQIVANAGEKAGVPCTRTGSGNTSATPGWTVAVPGET
jgi:hypothetical protein